VSTKRGTVLVARTDLFALADVDFHGGWWWSSDRPAEVHLLVDSVEWVIGRDLLSRGVRGRVGEGDVQLCPSSPGLWVRLSSPHGEVLLWGSLRVAEDFLARTWRACPRWVESARVSAALDAFLMDVEAQR